MANMSSIEKIFVNSRLDQWYHQNFGLTRLLKHFRIAGSKSILEVGSGVGITTEILATKFLSSHIVAVDYDPEQVVMAKGMVRKPNVFFTQGDATKLAYALNTFDTCFASFLFHHVDDYPKAITEMYRVLKPQGKLYIIELSIPFVRPNRARLMTAVVKAGFTITRQSGRSIVWLECQKQ